MIDKQFWEELNTVWTITPQVKYVDANKANNNKADNIRNDDSEIPFDMVDFDGAVQAAFNGGDIPLKTGATMLNQEESEPEPEKPKRPQLDTEKFDELLEKQTLPDYVEACKLLKKCELPKEMNDLYISLIERIPVLQDAIAKFESVYQADISQFYEYYIPEALQLTATYLE